VSVVQLYAGAFFPGIMLAGLYIGYVIIVAKIKPEWAPKLPDEERLVAIPAYSQALKPRTNNALLGLVSGVFRPAPGAPRRKVLGQLFVALLPLIMVAAILGYSYAKLTEPVETYSTEGLEQMGSGSDGGSSESGGLAEPPREEGGLAEPPKEEGAAAEPKAEAAEPAPQPQAEAPAVLPAPEPERRPAPLGFWVTLGVMAAMVLVLYLLFNWARLEVLKMLLTSFFPLAVLILAVLGTIVFGLATPTEAAAVGSFGGFLLAIAYRYADHYQRPAPGVSRAASGFRGAMKDIGPITKESTFLTAKTAAMVCWLFVGSSIFSAAFALLGGQELVEKWVLSMDLTPVQFMLLAQAIIFILGWPLEWTEIIVIFMPIFIPLLGHFDIDPLFFGLLVAMNLQTAFLSPPVAMAAFYLKGVSPSHVTLNQIFAGMIPFMIIQVIALALLYIFPGIGLWLPSVLYN
jgi:TRAP-type mannitol/chloroaromatic compound transport system permease large subunit